MDAPLRVVCVSDTHNQLSRIALPAGDILIHAGDMTMSGTLQEIRAFDAELSELPYRHKVVIAGNHDFAFEQSPRAARGAIRNAIYLEDEEATVAGLRIYGSPWQPWFMDWAFNLRRGPEIRAKWDLIANGLDILLTHGPPRGILDRNGRGEDVGCDDLREVVAKRAPRFHVFGHIHEAYGTERTEGTTYVNACSCDAGYRPSQPPIVIEVPMRGGAG